MRDANAPHAASTGPGIEGDVEKHILEAPIDLAQSLTLQRLGRFDPTAESGPGTFEKTFVSCAGALVRYRLTSDGQALGVAVKGERCEDDDRFLAQFPLDDGLSSFVPQHGVLRRIVAAFPGLRLLRVPWVFDVAAGAILQQRVTFAEAAAGFRRIAVKHGTRGPLGLAFPSARQLAALPDFELRALGIDLARARALHALAREERFRSFLHVGVERGELRKRLARIPGVGPWTTEMILGFGTGDPDALPVGDVHLPGLVCRALAGEPNGTDGRMTDLLEPYRGQRFRVVRLLWAAQLHAPRLLGRQPG